MKSEKCPLDMVTIRKLVIWVRAISVEGWETSDKTVELWIKFFLIKLQLKNKCKIPHRQTAILKTLKSFRKINIQIIQ